jgi:5-formyltetrahydrofolate cyclo-ligase
MTSEHKSGEHKSGLRREARARRAELARACPDFAGDVTMFEGMLAVAPGTVVAGYWPVRDEADPRLLMNELAERGAVLALPRIDARHAELSFRRWNAGDPLANNRFAILEPSAAAARVTPDIVLVPLLAFDSTGHRLGYGGGYYDRTLAALKARAIGIAYAGQEVDALPREAHDHPLEAVLTENGLTKF